MPRERFFNLAPEARARLLDAAAKHFARHGFDGASLNEILAEVGISKGAYYYYFDDKDDLFATALENAIDAALARTPIPAFERLTREQFWPAVERFVEEWAAGFDSSSDLVQAALQLTETQRRSPRYAPMFAKAQAMYRDLVVAGQRVGCIRRDLPTEVLVRLLEANDAVLDGVFLATQRTVTRASLDRHVRLVFDTFKRLLVVEPGAAVPPASKTRARRRRD
jgi:AcrR family transcriptional regulator